MFLFVSAILIALLAMAWLAAFVMFDSKDHSGYDLPPHPSTGTRSEESVEHKAVAKTILDSLSQPPPLKGRALLHMMREQLDARGSAMPISAQVRTVTAGSVSAEWVSAANSSATRRLLYIHGGAYMVGSAKSHRYIASRLAEVSGATVLSISYRLMPENSRLAGIEDCREAYAWLLQNGPNGPSELESLVVAGDSSGGNLALSTIAWARDTQLRAADAVVVLSPQTDATLASPSLKTNVATDIMQGKSFGPLASAPKVFSLWFTFFGQRIKPNSPLVSPLLGDLSDLPPTLLQVSEAEMFFDDSIRYANKAIAHGSPVVLQTWPFVMHVWQAFDVPETDEAFAEIEKFLAIYLG